MFNIIFRIERWKYNIEYGIYVSSEGRIKSKSKEIIKPRTTNTGYLIVKLNKKMVPVHRLVMYTWRPTEHMTELTVDHLDHNKRNNSIRNLEWVTQTENQRRAIEDFERLDNKEIKDIFKTQNENNNISNALNETIYVNDILMTYQNIIDFFWGAPTIQGNFKTKKEFKQFIIDRYHLNQVKEKRGKIKKTLFGVATVRLPKE